MTGDTAPAVLDVGPQPGGPTAAQQPHWASHASYLDSCEAVASSPALVTTEEIDELRSALAAVAAGRALLLQAGDCAESFRETTEPHTRAKLAVLHRLADQLAAATGQAVVRVGRLGGQFAKPRSAPVENVREISLPAFRGHMVNSEEPTPQARSHDPRRMVTAYLASAAVLAQVRADRAERAAGGPGAVPDGPWSSHDALILDYETNLVRPAPDGPFLASTHLPWIGDRTRHPDSAHVRLLSGVANPVACKVGPATSIEDLCRLCDRLDPGRVPGRLTLIVRMGRTVIADLLPGMLAAVWSRGHPVIWLTDPMHGNTIRVGGLKTRRLEDIVAEATEFRRILERHGAHPGGLHIEVAADHVTECIGGTVRGPGDLSGRYTTLCDPRLSPEQAAELVADWAGRSDNRPLKPSGGEAVN